jgi:hypothetical protein
MKQNSMNNERPNFVTILIYNFVILIFLSFILYALSNIFDNSPRNISKKIQTKEVNSKNENSLEPLKGSSDSKTLNPVFVWKSNEIFHQEKCMKQPETRKASTFKKFRNEALSKIFSRKKSPEAEYFQNFEFEPETFELKAKHKQLESIQVKDTPEVKSKQNLTKTIPIEVQSPKKTIHETFEMKSTSISELFEDFKKLDLPSPVYSDIWQKRLESVQKFMKKLERYEEVNSGKIKTTKREFKKLMNQFKEEDEEELHSLEMFKSTLKN